MHTYWHSAVVLGCARWLGSMEGICTIPSRIQKSTKNPWVITTTHFSRKRFVFIISARIQDIHAWGIQQNIWPVSRTGLKKNKLVLIQSYSKSFAEVTKGIVGRTSASACSYTGTDRLDLGLFPELLVNASTLDNPLRNIKTFHKKQIVFADLDRKILH